MDAWVGPMCVCVCMRGGVGWVRCACVVCVQGGDGWVAYMGGFLCQCVCMCFVS